MHNDDLETGAKPGALSRRAFLKGAGGVAAASGALAATTESPGPQQAAGVLQGEMEIEFHINGELQKVRVEPRTTLLSMLRHKTEPALTGTKEVCDRGNCGACTVLIDDKPQYACMLLAVDLIGKQIRTVEGLGTPEAMSPVQEAFCAHDASMCGFCTPGFVMATTAVLENNPAADGDEIRRGLSGNLCRCGTYPHIFSAAEDAGRQMAGQTKGGERK